MIIYFWDSHSIPNAGSRFSAYAKGKGTYVVETTHPDNELWKGSKADSGEIVSTMKEDIKATCNKVRAGWGGRGWSTPRS